MSKKKTSLMLPIEVSLLIEDAREMLGVPKNAFLAMGACLLLVQVGRLKNTSLKRRQYLRRVEIEFQKLLEEALEEA